jgi:succinate dehydrogenase / fumarate reductase flavoprotein subunit
LIRTLQDPASIRASKSTWNHVVTLLKGGDRVVERSARTATRGRFKVFKAKAIVLATGGIGRAYKITSNSWEYTGDGQSLAYHAGAELIDMEFVQFHPTGMVWPPSVMGILVTEGVRGEGGVLRNKDGKRFMFADIPESYKSQTADNPEEGWRYTQVTKMPAVHPNFTRDHVSRASWTKSKPVEAARMAGCFDIAWIRKMPSGGAHQEEAAEHIINLCGSPTLTSPRSRWKSADDTSLWRYAWTRNSNVERAGLFAVGGGCRIARREPAGRKFIVGPARIRQARGRIRREFCQRTRCRSDPRWRN